MKSLLLFTTAALLSVQAVAQKTDKTNLDYEMEMLPKEIISKDKKFDVIVEYDYKEKADAANAEVQEKKDQAKQDKEDYKNKSFGQKLGNKVLLGEGKPSGQYNNTDFIPTLFPEEGVKGSVNIPGYSKVAGSAGTVNVKFFELSYTVDKTKGVVSYYPLKIVATVTNDKGATVFQGDVPNNNTAMSYTIPTSGLNLSGIKSCETAAKNEAIKNLNAFLKTEFGYNMVKDKRPFFDVKDKKQTYPEYHQAIEKVKAALIFANVPTKQDALVAGMKEAIGLWENSLKELDKDNEDARINKDIAAATYINIAEASIWAKEFDKAYEALANYKALDEDYNKSYKDIMEFLKDYSSRYNKYTQY